MAKHGDRMPFGKFKGTPIASVPDWYLQWFCENGPDCKDIRRVMGSVLASRHPVQNKPSR
mgnify:FL=1